MSNSPVTPPFLAALEASGELVLPLEGRSMGPRWARAEAVRVYSAARHPPRWGDVVLFERFGRMYAHRLIFCWGDRCWTKGDARWAWDRPPPRRGELFAVVAGLVPEQSGAIRSRFRALWEGAWALLVWPVLAVRGPGSRVAPEP